MVDVPSNLLNVVPAAVSPRLSSSWVLVKTIEAVVPVDVLPSPSRARTERPQSLHNNYFTEDHYGGFYSRPNDHFVIQHHQYHPLDCHQLPLNNKYTDGLIINPKGSVTIHITISHAEICAHMKILFHQDPKAQKIKKHISRQISGHIGLCRRNVQLVVPPCEDNFQYLESISVYPDTSFQQATFYALIDRICAITTQTHVKLPPRRDFRLGTKPTNWKHVLTYG